MSLMANGLAGGWSSRMNCSFQRQDFAVTEEGNAFEPANWAGAGEFDTFLQGAQLSRETNELSSLQEE